MRLNTFFSHATLVLTPLLMLAGCGGERPAPPPTEAAPGNELRIEAPQPAPGFQLVYEDVMTTGTRLQLRWTGAAPKASEEPEAIGLCLPEGERVSAKWVKGTIQGTPIRIQKAPLSTTATLAGPWLPEAVETIESVGVLRRWPIYRLRPNREIYDVLQRCGATSPSLELTLDVNWTRPAALKPTSATMSKAEESWLRVAHGVALNRRGLELFGSAHPAIKRDAPQTITDPRRLAPGSRPWARLEITTAGLTRLDPDQLLKVGFTSEQLKPEAIRIFSHGKPVPLLLAPSAGAPAGIKPGVYFYARGGEGAYSATRTYWVTTGEELPACRLGALPGDLKPEACRLVQTVRRDAVRNVDNECKTRQGEFMAIDGLEWVEMPLEVGKAIAVTLPVPDYTPTSDTMTAELDFFITRSDALTPFKIQAVSDREALADLTFYAASDCRKTFNIPRHCVKDGKVVLALQLTGEPGWQPDEETGGSGFWLDKFTIHYQATPRLEQGRLTLTNDAGTTGPIWAPLAELGGPTTAPQPALALALDGAGDALGTLPPVADAQGRRGICRRLAAGERVEVVDARMAQEAPEPDAARFDDVLNEAQGADMVIIAHRDFMSQAAELKRFHEAGGWKVRLVDVQSLYDSFSDGELSPVAIKSFLAYALSHWKQGAPGQALLLGDCTSDYLNKARNEVRNWVPTYRVQRGVESWASDYWLTTVAGEDDLGDLMIGRISVANEKDANTVARKTIAYGSAIKPGPWRARLAMVADAGEFADTVEELRKRDTPASYPVTQVYLKDQPLEDNWYLARDFVERKKAKVSRATTQRILEAFRKGTAFLTYYGHGSPNIWSEDRIWFGGNSVNSDNQHLAGSGYCSFVANMTCNSGLIDYPQPPWNICITEDMMRIEDGGAIACFVPAGPGVTAVHREMSRALGRALFDLGLRRLGEVTTLAKSLYAVRGNPDDLLFMYHLLGDPLLELQLAARGGELKLRPEAVTPGAAPEWMLTGLEPAAGQWSSELAGDDGRTIWSSAPAAYQEGQIALKVPIPADLKSQDAAVLRVYAWDPQSGKEVSAAGRLAIQRPQLNLESVTITTDTARVAVRITNPGLVKAGGELEVTFHDTKSSQTLKREAIALEPRGEFRKEFAWPEAADSRGPLVAEAALRLPAPPDDPAIPQVIRQRILARAGGADWLGFVGPLCAIDERNSDSAVVRVTAMAPAGSGPWVASIRCEGVSRVTSQTMQADPAYTAAMKDARTSASVISTAFTLDRVQFERALRAGAITLEPGAGAKRNGTPKAEPLPVSPLERRRPNLRFVEGSLRVRPARPTEGETVYVDLEIENAGNANTDPASVELLQTPPAQGGEPATDMMQNGPRQISPLAPGRRMPVTLRWDPVGNAGARTLYARLHLASAIDSAHDPLTSVTVAARTKSSLKLGKVEVETNPRDFEAHRVTLKAVVKNTGQTDAHSVMVSFYRSGVVAPENKLGETEIKTVPGEGEAEARLVWSFDPLRDMVKGTQFPQPTVQVWLKGSQQRISNVDPKE